MKFLSAAISSLAFCQTAWAASAAQWRSRSIYQIMTDRFARTDGSTTATCNTGDQIYCGGTWQGIINHLDYIQNMGFDAIWISPVTKQVSGTSAYGTAYHGYWQTDLYQLNSNFGTADDLKALSSAVHARGMYLMVGVVVNHFGWIGSPDSVDYSSYNPFNTQADFHDYCAIDYNDQNSVVNCWLGDTTVPLPDLRTENSNVASGYQTWIKQLISNYSIDGLRMDTVQQVNTGFWPGFRSAANTHIIGEVYDGDVDYVCGYQDYVPGLMNYGVYFSLISAFQTTSGSMSDLASALQYTQSSCSDISVMGTFSENHDVARFPQLNEDMAVATNVIAFTMLSDGIPIIWQGQEQHFDSPGGSSVPWNRGALWFSSYSTSASLYAVVASMNKARKAAIKNDASFLTSHASVISTDAHTIAFKKGKMVMVLTNAGSSEAASTKNVAAGYAANTALTEILTCNTITADGSGNIAVPMSGGQPHIYYPTAGISSGLCGTSAKAKRQLTRSAKFLAIDSD